MPDKESKPIRKVMISSTALDLPEHREGLVNACLRQTMFPLRMEDLHANSDEAAAASLKMVDQADIYIGVFANRYGYIPKANNANQISVTEMEYNRAIERNIERLVFIMDKSHPITVDDVDIENAAKLKEFKERVQTENIVKFFKSASDLRAEVINGLSKLREPNLTEFHYVSDIPEPPEEFIAHPYTLLQTHKLVGRQVELNLLTDWVAKPESEIYQAHILNIVAIGGLGKSALTWKWFNDIAPQEMKPLAGRMWWSFYESDASFENFVTRALAYATKRALDVVQQIPAPDRESQLLGVLDREPFLIVLDGLERILIAYARMDAAHLSDDDYDKQTANYVANAIGLPASAAQSFTGEHRLRKTADPRAGAFLRKLSRVRAARVLVSTRLYPADLQTATGESLGSSTAIFLHGLADDDALDLWRAFGVSGQRDSLLQIFNRVDNHPLLIQALASEVASYRRSPGDFEKWRQAHSDFDPFGLPLVQVKSHVLEFALRGLSNSSRSVLQVIAAFRMPARYDTLTALLVAKKRRSKRKPVGHERELDKVLTELEDRGLVGWDKRANRYDLHPIVRGVVWNGLGGDTQRGVYSSLHAHFESLPKADENSVSSIEDLTPAIELFSTLIGLGRYDDAALFYFERLGDSMLYRLCANRHRLELLEMLFPDGLDQLPRLNNADLQADVLGSLALAYGLSGQPARAVPFHKHAIVMCGKLGDLKDFAIASCNLGGTLTHLAALRDSTSATHRALVMVREQKNRFQESSCLYVLGQTLATRGIANESKAAMQRALRILVVESHKSGEGLINFFLAQIALWVDETTAALTFANRAWELAHFVNYERDFIHAARVQGEAALGLNDFATADERLHHALTRARVVNLVEEELPALVALAELRRRQGDLKAARKSLDDVWEAAERGPYPLYHSDAFNVLAQIEHDEGNTAAAVEAATNAYRLAWCDGTPFAYHWGLEKAKKHLKELGAPEPDMPPFDESKFEPMLEVEIDPDDEFHVGNAPDE